MIHILQEARLRALKLEYEFQRRLQEIGNDDDDDDDESRAWDAEVEDRRLKEQQAKVSSRLNNVGCLATLYNLHMCNVLQCSNDRID